MKKRKVFVIAGGSGGHVFPAQQIYESLNNLHDFQTYFVTDTRGLKFFDKIFIPIIVTKSITPSIKSFIKIIYNFLLLFYYFLKIRPKIIIGFGGITTIIPAIIAKIFKIPVIIHEQNSSMGKANRFLMKHIAAKTLLSFPDTKNIINNKLTSYVGLPIRNKIKENIAINNDELNFKLLIIAGSQGANFFDENIPIIIEKIFNTHRDEIKNLKFTLYQQVNQNNIDNVKKIYTDLGIDFVLKPFFENIEEYFSKSHLVIARSGASTIFEILQTKTPAILIPMENSSENHQYQNAVEFSKIQPSINFIEEKNINNLYQSLIKIFKSKEIITKAHQELIAFQSPDVEQLFHNNIIEVLKNYE